MPFGDKGAIITVVTIEIKRSILKTSRQYGRVFLIIHGCHLLLLTARQYGEVVLPAAASGHDPDTLARNLSRCKEGMAHFLPSWYKFY